jgi:transcriptional regulator with XRE-family HTH domain
MSDLSALLRRARESKGWSLQESAEMLGTTKGHLHDLESGRSDNPTLRLVAAIVIVYGIRPEAIVATVTKDPA